MSSSLPRKDFEEKRKNEVPTVRYCAVSAIESGHKAPITDVQWLPETFEVRGEAGLWVCNADVHRGSGGWGVVD